MAVVGKNAFRLVVSRNNYSLSLGHFLDGSDVYGATALRCLFQFYFSLRLPNSYDHPNIDSDMLAGIIGGFGAVLLVAIIIGTGWYYQKQEKKRWSKKELTDELLLLFYVNDLDKNVKDSDDQSIKDIRAMIELFESEDKKRLNDLRTFVETKDNRTTIIEALKNAKVNTSESSSLESFRNHGYEFVKTYAYVQWIFWMIVTIILCQAKTGFTTDSDDLSPGLYPELTGQEWTIYVQLLVGAVVAFGMLLYDLKKKREQNALKSAEVDAQLSAVRKVWMADKVYHSETEPAAFDEGTRYAHALTLTTTFIGQYLLFNIAAWPIAIFIVDKGEPNIGELFFAITIITGALAAIQTGIKYRDLLNDQSTYTEAKENGFDPSKFSEAHPKLNTIQFWWDDLEHRRRGAYFVFGSFLGSGGYLLMRVLFSNGIGNVTLKDGKFGMDETMMAHGSVTDPLFYIGAIACVVLMALSMAEYRKNTLRTELVQAAKDHQLVYAPARKR